jgi:hypothetical protein
MKSRLVRAPQDDKLPRVIRIAITGVAFEAIAATLPLGSGHPWANVGMRRMAFDDNGFGDLDYQTNFERFASRLVRGKNVDADRHFTNSAKDVHILAVNNALMKLLDEVVRLSLSIELTQLAKHYLRFGVGRRLGMLRSSFVNFQGIIMPDRATPLTIDQSDEACRDLNSMYINIIGVLDNYAWVMVHQLGGEKTKRAQPRSIGLFKSTLAADCNLKPIIDALSSFSDWERDIKDRRDPAAHRMPLYVPPAVYTAEELAHLDRYESLIVDALRAQDFQRLSDLRSARDRVGSFHSIFLHDPGIPPAEIYPTIPQDIGRMIKIGRIIQSFLPEATAVR